MVTTYATSHPQQAAVLNCVETGLRLWMRYREGVAKACRLRKPG
jgi:head-tail adaptor